MLNDWHLKCSLISKIPSIFKFMVNWWLCVCILYIEYPFIVDMLTFSAYSVSMRNNIGMISSQQIILRLYTWNVYNTAFLCIRLNKYYADAFLLYMLVYYVCVSLFACSYGKHCVVRAQDHNPNPPRSRPFHIDSCAAACFPCNVCKVHVFVSC